MSSLRAGAFYEYLRRHKYSSIPDDCGPTHLLMNGQVSGKLYVPDDELADMLSEYASAVSNGAEIPLIENGTPYVRWFCDIDFKSHRQLTRTEMIEYARCVQETVSTFFKTADGTPGNDRLFDLVLLTNMPKDQMYETADEAARGATAHRRLLGDKDSTSQVKTGLHLYMPNLYVTSEQCLTIRMSVLMNVEKCIFESQHWADSFSISTDMCNSIEDQVDRNVYVNPNLRMPGAVKWGPCPNCKQQPKKRATCVVCNKLGKLSLGSAYTAKFYLRGPSKPSEYVFVGRAARSDVSTENFEFVEDKICLRNLCWVVTNCCLRDTRSDSNGRGQPVAGVLFQCPANAPRDHGYQEQPKQVRKRKAPSAPGKPEVMDPDGKTVKDSSALKSLVTNKTLIAAAQVAVIRAATQHFGPTSGAHDLRVRSLTVLTKPKSKTEAQCYWVTVRGSCQNWCQNLKDTKAPGGSHTSASHYWMITRPGLRQLCFSRKTSSTKWKRQDRPCSKYNGDVTYIMSELETSLFFDCDVTEMTAAVPLESRDSDSDLFNSLMLSSSSSSIGNDSDTQLSADEAVTKRHVTLKQKQVAAGNLKRKRASELIFADIGDRCLQPPKLDPKLENILGTIKKYNSDALRFIRNGPPPPKQRKKNDDNDDA